MKYEGRSGVKSILRRSLLLRTSYRVVLLVAVTLPAFVALASGSTAHAAGPESDQMVVYVSILPQAFFVARIGGENVRVQVLVGPGESPATFDPTPRQMADIAAARVFFTTGVPMEEALLPRVLHNFPAVAIIDTRVGIEQLGDRAARGRRHHLVGQGHEPAVRGQTAARHESQGQRHQQERDGEQPFLVRHANLPWIEILNTIAEPPDRRLGCHPGRRLTAGRVGRSIACLRLSSPVRGALRVCSTRPRESIIRYPKRFIIGTAR